MHTPTFIHAHTEAKWDLHRIIIQNIWQTLKIVIKISGNFWACFLTFLCLRQTLFSTFIPSSAYKNTPRKTRNISEESLLFTLRFCVSHKFTQNWSFYDVSVFDDIFKTSEDFWKFFWLRVLGASILPISYHSSSLFHSTQQTGFYSIWHISSIFFPCPLFIYIFSGSIILKLWLA